jgi:hypothetical protein
VLLTRSPLSPAPKGWFSLDLHVLSAPPAFVLSQDQTLREDLSHRRSAGAIFKVGLSSKSPRREETGSVCVTSAAKEQPRFSTFTLLSFQRPRPFRAAHEKGLRSWRPLDEVILERIRLPLEGLLQLSRRDRFVRSRFRQPTHDSSDRMGVKRSESARIGAFRPEAESPRARRAGRPDPSRQPRPA